MEASKSKYFDGPVPHQVLLGSDPYEAQVAFVSVNEVGTIGELSRQVMKKLGYSENVFPAQKDLVKGFHFLEQGDQIPIVFIVSVSDNRQPEQNLTANLSKAIDARGKLLFGKKWWIPLMATGGGALTFYQSYSIIVNTLANIGINRLGATVLISVPESAEGRKFFAGLDLSANSNKPRQESDPRIGYWVVKFNRKNWGERFTQGRLGHYNTHLPNGQQREEYDLFTKIKERDIALGFDHSSDGNIACIFRITGGISLHPSYGEVIQMSIDEILTNPIPIDNFRDAVSFADKLSRSAPVRLIPIDEQIYKSILSSQSIQEVKIPGGRKSLHAYYLTEGNHHKTEDQLRFQDDIDSLANVIALKSVDPPLAIGLFGHWGSGKSFFMQKLEERIDELKQLQSDTYVKTVVHVRFNSWHYSDSNLWACLITELFESLNSTFRDGKAHDDLKRLTQTLSLTSSQKKVAEAKAGELETKISKLKETQADQREKLEDLSGLKMLKLVLSDKEVQNDLAALKSKDIEKIINDRQELGQYLEVFQKSKAKFEESVFIIKGARGVKGWRWAAMILGAASVGAVIFFGLKYFIASEVLKGITSFLSAAGTMLLLLARKAKVLTDQLERYYTKISSLYTTVTRRESAPSPELDRDVAELDELKYSLSALDKKINDTRTEIDDILSGRKLMEFIGERVKDEGYARQLGLISWIRRDFGKLDELLRKQHQLDPEERNKIFNPENVTLQIDRIVLYIDDLDRCKEEIVVKVLEAVHLLLAFPLFVVVVGVDPRWLNNALDEKYKTLLRGSKSTDDLKSNGYTKTRKTTGQQDDEHTEEELILAGVATTYDYLEKIFQIPFTIKPIHKEARKDLIAYLIRNELETPTMSSPTLEPVKLGLHAAPSPQEPYDDIQPDLPPAEPLPPPFLPPMRAAVIREKLIFTNGEKAYMQEICHIFGHTPRSINRYVNIYRIIKSHNSFEVTESFSEDDYIPVMALLSIVVGYSVFAQQLISALTSVSDEQSTMKEFLAIAHISERLKELMLGEAEKNVQNKKTKMKNGAHGNNEKGLGDKALAMPLSAYRQNLELISRFSFRTISL